MYQTAYSYYQQPRVSCYKLPTFSGWMALSNAKQQLDRSNMLIQESHFVISSNMESVILLSETLEEECKHHKLPEQDIVLIRLAIVEALNNIVEHAYRSEDYNEIDVYLYFHKKSFKIELKDNGFPNQHGTKPINLILDRNDIMNIPEGGYGLNIIHDVMDSVEYERKNGINIMRMEKFFL
jgi:serine/threonine-protein kinase RsbW